MGLEDELRRVLRSDRLDVSVRTGAEWSLVAGARRRRRHRNTMAAVSGMLTASVLVGGSVALVGHESSGNLPPATPPVVTSTSDTPEPTETEPPAQEPPGPGDPGQGQRDQVPPRVTSIPVTPETELPSVLREPTSQPEPTSSAPSSTTSPPDQTSEAPPTSSEQKSAGPEP